MDVAESVNGVPIRLPDERWAHILEVRDDLAGLRPEVLSTIEFPDAIAEGREGELLAVRGV